MPHRNHKTAWRIIDGANERWDTEPERIENEGDAGLIVAGATLEETENLSASIGDLSKAIESLVSKPLSGSLFLHIGTKTMAALVTVFASGVVGAVVAVLR